MRRYWRHSRLESLAVADAGADTRGQYLQMHSFNILAFPLIHTVHNFFNGGRPHVEKHDVHLTLVADTRSLPVVSVLQPQRSPNPPDHFPPEIVVHILEVACDPHDTLSSVRLLTSAALVCKAWSDIAQKLLFRHVTLRSQSALNSLTDALCHATSRSQVLARAVTHARVIMDPNQPGGLPQHAFAHVLKLCPRLTDLDISLFGKGSLGQDIVGSPAPARMRRFAPLFDADTISALRSGPLVTHLRFSNWTDNSTLLSQLLDVWPSLRTLEIRGTPPTIGPQATLSSPRALEELRINCQRPPEMGFLKCLLRNSKSSMRKVQADRDSCSEALVHALHWHPDSLVSIAIPSCSDRETAAGLGQCQQLDRLTIEDARVAMALCPTLPSHLSHIALGVHRDTNLGPLLRLISQGSRLTSVVLHLWRGGDSNSALKLVQASCITQNIRLDVVTNIHEFRGLNPC